jgi:hypothetical protein
MEVKGKGDVLVKAEAGSKNIQLGKNKTPGIKKALEME